MYAQLMFLKFLIILSICIYLCRLGNKVKLSWKLLSIGKLENGSYTLTYETPEGLVTVQSKTVVMTIPSHIASTLLRPVSVWFISNAGKIRFFHSHQQWANDQWDCY